MILEKCSKKYSNKYLLVFCKIVIPLSCISNGGTKDYSDVKRQRERIDFE